MERIITPCMEELHPIEQIATQPKIALLAETGTIPSAAALAGEKAEWVSYMTWGRRLLPDRGIHHQRRPSRRV